MNSIIFSQQLGSEILGTNTPSVHSSISPKEINGVYPGTAGKIALLYMNCHNHGADTFVEYF